MKTYTATELNKGKAREIFRNAEKDGAVIITNENYPDVYFELKLAGPSNASVEELWQRCR